MQLNWNPPKIRRETARHINRADYALDVHAGDVRHDGTRTPDRPWMTATIEEVDICRLVVENYKITGNINEAFENAMYDLKAEFEASIQDERWEWDRAPSPRDIIDTGHLLESQDLEFF